MDWVSRVVASIGREAGNVVAEYPRTGKVKHAILHDRRGSFGVKWAARVLPRQLQELIRHESIETTLKYYVGQDALRTAELCGPRTINQRKMQGVGVAEKGDRALHAILWPRFAPVRRPGL